MNLQESSDKNIELSNETGLNEKPQKGAPSKKIIIFIGIILSLLFFLFSVFFKTKDEEKIESPSSPEVGVQEKDFFSNIINSPPPPVIPTDEEKVDREIIENKEPPFLLGENIKIEKEPIKLIKSNSGMMLAKREKTQSESKSITELENELNDPYNAPAFTPVLAQKSKFNPNLLLSQGTVIPCSLRGKLVSSVGGQLSCIISDDVLSSNGNVVLIEKGSIVNGYYQGNSVERGQSYLFVVWQEVRTPNNLIIPLNSGSTDELGANGLKGWVDNHFWKRFGNAIVLSLIKDVSGALAQNMTKDGRRDYFENTRTDSVDITTEIIRKGLDIAPTLYKNQGDKINIFVARDIDFSKVYNIKKKW